MSHVFSRIVNEQRTHFLELYYDEFDENPLLYYCCTVDLWDRHGGCWVGSDYKWSDYRGIRDRYSDPNSNDYIKGLKKIVRKGGVVLSVYCHEHSGITFKCSSFSDPCDSGQVGYAYMSTKDIVEFGWPKGKRGRREAADNYIRHAVGNMAAYANGDIYGFAIYDKDGELVDGCGGFYESHYGEGKYIDDMRDNAPAEFHHLFDEYHPGRMDDLEYSRRIPPVA